MQEILIAEQGKKINNLVVGPFGEEVINDNGDKLIDICEQNSLKILKGYFKHKRIHQYTWHQDTQIYNKLHYCQTKFWFKISRCKSI